MKKLILMGLFSIPLIANAELVDLTIDFSGPAIREDGTPLSAAEISAYNFYDGCNTTPSLFATATIDGTVTTSVDWADNSSHSICFSTIDTDGQEGILSVPYNVTFSLISKPGAGSINSITVTCVNQKCKISSN